MGWAKYTVTARDGNAPKGQVFEFDNRQIMLDALQSSTFWPPHDMGGEITITIKPDRRVVTRHELIEFLRQNPSQVAINLLQSGEVILSDE